MKYQLKMDFQIIQFNDIDNYDSSSNISTTIALKNVKGFADLLGILNRLYDLALQIRIERE